MGLLPRASWLEQRPQVELPSSLVPVIASAVAALIAGGVAYVMAVLSKEQKTSEFRQAWIDGLRTDIADFVSGRTEIALMISAMQQYGMKNEAIRSFFFEQFPDLVTTKAKYHQILLRINPREHKTLLAALQRLEAIQPLAADESEVDYAARQVTEEAQRVLKTEWNRVKQGETVFLWTKRVALTVMLCALAIGILALARQAKIASAA